MNLDHPTVLAVLAVAVVVLTAAYCRPLADRDHWRAKALDAEWREHLEQVPGIGGRR